MFLSRIWTILITLFALTALMGFYLATPPAEAALQDAYETQLDTAQGLVNSHLRMESRRRLDFFLKVGQDVKLAKLLKTLGSQPKVKYSLAAAKSLNEYLSGKLIGSRKGDQERFRRRFDNVEVVDNQGRVWVRLGRRSGTIGDNIKNFPGIRDALRRRVCVDNTVDLGGKLHFVWACPVAVVEDGQKIALVGAVRGIKAIDRRFASALLTLIGEAEAAAARARKKNKKGGAKAKKKKERGDKKASINLGFFRKGKLVASTSKSSLWAKAPGLYKKHQKLVDKRTIGRSPPESVEADGKRHLMVLGRLPGGASGRGNYFAILWKVPAELGPTAFFSSKLSGKRLFKHFPTVLFIFLAIVMLGMTVFVLIWEHDRPVNNLLAQVRDLAAGKIDHIGDEQFKGKIGSIARSINESLERVSDAAPSRPALHEKDMDSILGSDEGGSGATSSAGSPFGDSPMGAPVDRSMSSPAPFPAPSSAPDPGRSQEVSVSGLFSIPPDEIPGGGSGGDEPEDGRYRELFDEFVATKKQCNEPTDKLRYEAFAAKLRKNRDAVMQKTGAKEVNFRVYVKEGKAALKATPVKG